MEYLLTKLKHYGVRGVASDWVKSYLSNRKQFVNIDGCSSELLSVICGVPQGSILGPTLFFAISMISATYQIWSNLYFSQMIRMYFVLEITN